MRLLALLLSLTLLSANTAHSKKSKAKNTVANTQNLLSEFTHIEKLYGSSRSQYRLRADILIPAEIDEFAVMLHYDELSDHAIKDISWISGRKKIAVSALSVDSQVNTQLEKMLNRTNPGLAYDRLQTGKHVITKTYKFKKSKVFSSKKAEPQAIKITWDNNAVIYTDIDNLYLTEAEPTASPKARPTKMSPAPSPMPETSQGRKQVVPSAQDLANEQLQQQKLYEYEMLEIESTLKQMKDLESETENMGIQQFTPGGQAELGEQELGIPQLPEF